MPSSLVIFPRVIINLYKTFQLNIWMATKDMTSKIRMFGFTFNIEHTFQHTPRLDFSQADKEGGG